MVCVILLSRVYKPGIAQGKPGKEAKHRIGWKIPLKQQHEVKTSLLGLRNIQSRTDGTERILSQHSCIAFKRNPKVLAADYFPPGIFLWVSSVKSRGLKNPTVPTAPMGSWLHTEKLKPSGRKIPGMLIPGVLLSASPGNQGWELKHLLQLKFFPSNRSCLNNAKNTGGVDKDNEVLLLGSLWHAENKNPELFFNKKGSPSGFDLAPSQTLRQILLSLN